MSVPASRIRRLNNEHVMGSGDYVLYWMVAFRRLRHNFALQRAVERANELHKPLLALEGLRIDYPWASDRLHSFVIDGMRDNASYAASWRIPYYPYIEEAKGEGKGLVEALGSRACAIVTDDYPAFFIPHAIQAAAKKVSVLVEAVDSNGLLPLRSSGSAHPTAYAFRRMLQKQLPEHLLEMPESEPAASLVAQPHQDWHRRLRNAGGPLTFLRLTSPDFPSITRSLRRSCTAGAVRRQQLSDFSALLLMDTLGANSHSRLARL